MKKFVLLFVLLASVLVFSPTLAQFESDCVDNNIFADDTVAWCLLPGWSQWSETYDQANRLQNLLDELYVGMNVSPLDLGTFNNEPQTAVLLHGPIDGKLVFVQLFVSEYTSTSESVLEYIKNSWIEFDGIQYQLDIGLSTGGDYIGYVQVQVDEAGFRRAWIMYPYLTQGLIYTVAIYAPISAWEDKKMLDEFSLIASSLFIPQRAPVPVTTEEPAFSA